MPLNHSKGPKIFLYGSRREYQNVPKKDEVLTLLDWIPNEFDFRIRLLICCSANADDGLCGS
jgi:hypothetical protein